MRFTTRTVDNWRAVELGCATVDYDPTMINQGYWSGAVRA